VVSLKLRGVCAKCLSGMRTEKKIKAAATIIFIKLISWSEAVKNPFSKLMNLRNGTG
jgi:Fe-S cluster biogenesis protein NfuA